MRKNKIIFSIICTLTCALTLGGCATDSASSDNDKDASENATTYNGITNPAGERKAHTVTNPPKTTTVSTAVTTTTTAETKSETEAVTTITTTAETAATQTTTTAPTDSPTADASGISFSLSNQNSWEQNNQTVYQYEYTIENNTSSAISSWTVELPLSDASAELMQGWSAQYSVSNQTLIISPVEFNTSIEVGASVSFGFQIISSNPIDASSATLNANGAAINPTM